MAKRNLSEPLRAAVESVMSELHVCLPGRIERYDHTEQRAEVKPLLRRNYRDGDESDMPVIADVPVIWPRAGGASLTMPVQAGDGVLLVFADRSIDRWLVQGGEVTPDDRRKHDLSDCVAIPGLVPFAGFGDVEATRDPDAVVVQYGETTWSVHDDGRVEVDGDVNIDGDLDVDGDITATGDVQAGGDVVADSEGTAISLIEHTHIGNLGSSTSPPEP